MHRPTVDAASSPNLELDSLSLFEEAPIPTHEIDRNGILRRVNRAERELLGFDACDLIGSPVWKFVVSEEQEACQCAIERKLRTNIPGVRQPRTFVRRDGSHVPVEMFDRIMTDLSGALVGIRSAIIDISDRLEAENALLENKRWMEATLAALREAVVAVDPLGVIKFLNGAAESMIGLSSSFIVGNDAADLIHISALSFGSHQNKSFADVLHAGLFDAWTSRGLLQSNLSSALIPVEVSSSPSIIQDGSVLGIVFVIRELPPSP